jgi:hypothetical protein
MARYWVYLNDQVGGPYELDELIKLRGFSRRTLVCVDDQSGAPQRWISPAEIPELAPIFKVVDQVFDPSVPPPPVKPAPKPARPRMPTHLTPVASPAPPESHGGWWWIMLLAAVVAGGYYRWNQIHQAQLRSEERLTAQSLIETYPLPASSLYASLGKYLQSRQITSRWEFERSATGLQHVTLSWLPTGGETGKPIPVYAFEVNLQVESVRGLNSAAQELLAQGFPPPAAPKKAAPLLPTPADLFGRVLEERQQAWEQGDFPKVWSLFSRRKLLDMEGAGISETGFIRLQSLTHKLDAGLKQTVLKIKKVSENEMLVLLRQTQPGRQGMFLKQSWVREDGEWKLDSEEKKMAGSPPSARLAPSGPPAEAPKPAVPSAVTPAPAPTPDNSAKEMPPVRSLPGVSPTP